MRRLWRWYGALHWRVQIELWALIVLVLFVLGSRVGDPDSGSFYMIPYQVTPTLTH
jgi:hypothetical protein